MTNADRRVPDAKVELAISQVLDAEVKARDAVRDAEAQAVAMIEVARTSGRAIAERTERRIRRFRAAFEAQASDAVARIAAEADAANAQHEFTASDLAQIDAAVAVLAESLTGGASP